MAPSINDFIGSSFWEDVPQEGTQFVVSKEGAEKLNKMRSEKLKEGDIIVYPHYRTIDSLTMHTLWCELTSVDGGFQVPRGEDLFSEMRAPGRERK